MIIHECTVVNSVLYVKALVVLIVYSCRLKTTKNIIIYERILKKNQTTSRPSEHPPVMGEKCIIAVLTSKIKVLYI